MHRSLRPVAAAFVVFGSFAGVWSVAAADVERAFGLSDAQLGLLLAGGVVAGTAMAAWSGVLVDRWRPASVLAFAFAAWCALLVTGAAGPSLLVFGPAFVATMGAGGVVDVVMNVVAADAFAAEPGRLVRFHGLFNAGAALGAVVAGVALHAGASWRFVWCAVALAGGLLAVLGRRGDTPAHVRHEHPSTWRAIAGLRHEGLVVVATVFAASAMVEGGIATWGILYLRNHLGVGVLAGVSAFVAGEVLATCARIAGGPVVSALGSRRAVALGGALAAGGLVVEAVCGAAALAAAGLAVSAVGISVVWPLLMATVNNEARHPPLAIGGITACGYLGMVAGPPIVGALSGLFGLRTGLLFLAATAAFVACTPARVRAPALAT